MEEFTKDTAQADTDKALEDLRCTKRAISLIDPDKQIRKTIMFLQSLGWHVSRIGGTKGPFHEFDMLAEWNGKYKAIKLAKEGRESVCLDQLKRDREKYVSIVKDWVYEMWIWSKYASVPRVFSIVTNGNVIPPNRG